MKTWHLLPFVMVLGVMVGRWLPREELRTSKGGGQPVEAPPQRNDSFNNLTRMVQIPDRASRPPRRPPPAVEESAGAEAEGAPPAEESPRERRRREWRERRQDFAPEDLRARIDEAKDLWATRVEMARAQAFDRLDLTAAGEAVFDDAVNRMNESFLSTLQALADELGRGADMTPELGARVVSELSAAMVETYDGLMEALPPEKHGEISTMQFTDFIDPGVIEPLVDVQDKFQNIGPWGGGR